MGFFDGGAKSLSFGEVGSDYAKAVFGKWRGGIIVNIGDAKQQTDWKTRELKTWPNGDPIMQLPITLDTWAGRCPEPAIDQEDDGVRDYYITKGRQDFQAARAALRAANVKDFAVGGTLYTRWVKGEGRTGDPRQFEMHYEPPTQTSGGFMDDGPAAGPGPQQSMPPQVPPAQGGPWSAPAEQPGPIANMPAQQSATIDALAAAGPRFDPQTGQPLAPPPAAAQPRFDPVTGQPLAAAPAQSEPPRFDPQTGEPLNQAAADVLAGNQPPQAPAPAAGGWSPGQQTVPAGPPPQAAAQGVTNPWRR